MDVLEDLIREVAEGLRALAPQVTEVAGLVEAGDFDQADERFAVLRAETIALTLASPDGDPRHDLWSRISRVETARGIHRGVGVTTARLVHDPPGGLATPSSVVRLGHASEAVRAQWVQDYVAVLRDVSARWAAGEITTGPEFEFSPPA